MSNMLIKDYSEYEKYGEFDYHCPHCNKMIGSESYNECLNYKFCPECGGKINDKPKQIKELENDK